MKLLKELAVPMLLCLALSTAAHAKKGNGHGKGHAYGHRKQETRGNDYRTRANRDNDWRDNNWRDNDRDDTNYNRTPRRTRRHYRRYYKNRGTRRNTNGTSSVWTSRMGTGSRYYRTIDGRRVWFRR